MRILVTGGGGFLGRKLIAALLAGPEGMPAPEQILSLDRVDPGFDDPRVVPLLGELARPEDLERAVAPGVDLIWHLAAAVSAECEADLDLGLAANLQGTLDLLQAVREAGRKPCFVFTSSVAVYGGDLPQTVADATPITPDSSYGAQKAMGELLVKDFSRKGIIDGRSLRLPTVVVRPGKPNKAASGFASGIIREPLSGARALCPVPPEVRMALISPRRVVQGLLQAASLPASAFGPGRVMSLPGISVSVAEMAEALKRAGGQEAFDLIDWQPDAGTSALVQSWPQGVTSERALAAGLTPDPDMDSIVRAYIEDDLPGGTSS